MLWSHIIPNWVYRRTINFYPDGNTKLVKIGEGIAQYRVEQCAEYMLCSVCEHRFAAWESAAASATLQKLDPTFVETFPALQTALTKVIAANTNGIDKYANLSSEHDALARFALSVIWRAHKSRDHFPKVRLGAYDELIRALLVDDTKPSLPDWVQVTLHLIDPRGAPLDRIVMTPWSARASAGHRIHSFVFFGMWFLVNIGKDIPIVLRECCLARSGNVWIGDGSPLKKGVTDLKGGVKSVGQLAIDERNGKI